MTDAAFSCRCVLCHDYGDREAADDIDRMMIDHVQRYGWHVVMVPEDEAGPGFAYTVGLAHSYGSAELAVFGLDIHVMHRMLNRLGERVAAGAAVEASPMELRNVHPGWYRTFFGCALAFYRRPPLPFLQVAWPDADGRFPWDPAATPAHRDSQPLLWLHPRDHRSGVWTAELA
ncbi:DUF4262 domain-containing protein [Streptomyces bambusae]|uniref:DUF4262 domain-containing protein n=1 Tax=Streptomyces bambusae TaxID=1550616 RepID=UPI001CFC7004|nr:DUF4262 domain-containing protein [Streptomyces bambusae]MCB5166571.1 DUF4262 domain-containing protein [Streptomyces bambusae]